MLSTVSAAEPAVTRSRAAAGRARQQGKAGVYSSLRILHAEVCFLVLPVEMTTKTAPVHGKICPKSGQR